MSSVQTRLFQWHLELAADMQTIKLRIFAFANNFFQDPPLQKTVTTKAQTATVQALACVRIESLPTE